MHINSAFALQHVVIIHAKANIDEPTLLVVPTVTKSFRLDEKLVQRLSVLARKYKHTENQLVTNWLSWRISIDPLVPSFEGISLENEAFKSILSTARTDALELLGWELGKKQFSKSRALFEGAGEQMTFVRYVCEILGEHGGWFRVEGDVDESSVAITLHHNLTVKWSIFLRSYLSCAYEVVSKKKLVVETSYGFVKIKLPEREDAN